MSITRNLLAMGCYRCLSISSRPAHNLRCLQTLLSKRNFFSNLPTQVPSTKLFNGQGRSLLCVNQPSVQLIVRRKKSKDNKVGKASKGGNESQMFRSITREEAQEVLDYEGMCEEFTKAVENFKDTLVERVSLRNDLSAYNNIKVETSSGTFRLVELAQIAQKSPTVIAINLEAAPQFAKDVKLAILNSGLNVSPQQEGHSLFIPVVKITREHRADLAKNVRALATKSKDVLKSIHTKYTKNLNHAKSLDQDTRKHLVDLLTQTMKNYAAQVDSITEAKEKELLG